MKHHYYLFILVFLICHLSLATYANHQHSPLESVPLGSKTSGSETLGSETPRLMVHLLDYLAQDYGMAVSNGHIINAAEYEEQREFVGLIIENSQKLPAFSARGQKFSAIQSQLTMLQKLIVDKASADKVSTLARQIQSQVVKISQLKVSPSRWPNLDRGKQIYKKHCTSCHGVKGRGDGPLAGTLEPRPSNFLDDERMRAVSPFGLFNTIRLGILGTAMRPFNELSDKDVWDTAFYIASLRHHARHSEQMSVPLSPSGDVKTPGVETRHVETLFDVASLSDEMLLRKLPGDFNEKQRLLTALRLYSFQDPFSSFIDISNTMLEEALAYYKQGDLRVAQKKALLAYLEGVEPIESKLRANDPQIVVDLESRMSGVRSAMESHKDIREVTGTVESAQALLERARTILESNTSSPMATFLVTVGVVLREALEAILIIIALLSVLKTYGSQDAVRWVHGGWMFAIFTGGLAWIFSGWLMAMSGAQREFLEGVTSLLAVFILLYIGFWLHRKTEIHRWKAFIQTRVETALEQKNLFGLFMISFIAVFREAFETVLFLRAMWVESGGGVKTAMLSGLLSSIAIVCVLAWILLKYSARLPIQKLFSMSASLLIGLAIVLMGKGLHAFQEAGFLSINPSPLPLRFDMIGVYPTLETGIAQVSVVCFCLLIWFYDKKIQHQRPAGQEYTGN